MTPFLPQSVEDISSAKLWNTATPPQEKFWADTARFRAFVGGIGSGKTRAGVIEALRQPARTRGVILAPTYPMLRDATVYTFLEQAHALNMIDTFVQGPPPHCRLKNGTEVLFRSSDDPDRLRGPNLGWFYLDEAAMMDPEVWLIMIGRLREKPGRAWATSTPRGYNWLFEMFAEGDNPDYSMTTSSTRENTFLPADFVRSLEERYDEHWQAQEIEGRFVAISHYGVFDNQYLRGLVPFLPEPIQTWECGHNGISGTYLLWEEPVPGVRYTIGADVSEGIKHERSDESDSCILRNDTWAEVGHYFGKPDPKSYAHDLWNLSEWYNRAELNVENNSVGLVTISYLEDLSAHLWYNDPDQKLDLGDQPDRDLRAGFRTTERSKGLVDGELRSAVVDAAQGRPSVVFRSKRRVEQMIHYVYLPNGGRGAEPGWLDDGVRSGGLAWYVAKDHGLRPPEQEEKDTGNPYGGLWRGRGR